MGNGSVWVVTSGEYSDFRIEGIFSTKKRADRLVRALDNYDVEAHEWELDVYGDAEVRTRYDVVVHPRTSEILEVRKIGEFGTESPRVVSQKFHYTVSTEFLGEQGTFSATIDALRAVVYATNEDKARKAATDAVAKYKAEKEGL